MPMSSAQVHVEIADPHGRAWHEQYSRASLSVLRSVSLQKDRCRPRGHPYTALD